MKRFLLFLSLFFIAPPLFAQASQVYLTPSGTAVGNCPTGTGSAPNFTPAQFNNSSNWGSSTGKIGSDTHVLLCGTLSFSSGGSGLIAQGSGTSGHPIVVTWDTGATVQSTAFGSYDSGFGGFVVNGLSYIILDGGTNGILQNTANASPTAVNSTGVWFTGTGVGNKVRNLKIQNICDNSATGTNPSTMDLTCENTIDLVVDTGQTYFSACNNYFWTAGIGVLSGVNDNGGGTGTQAICQSNTTVTAGANFYLNSFNVHYWDMSLGGGGSPQVYANSFISDHTTYTYPNSYSGKYHQDGIISYGYVSGVPALVSPVIFNNIFGITTPTGSNGTAAIFCTGAAGSPGSGANCTGFNNVVYAPVLNGSLGPITIGGQTGFDVNSTSVTSNVLTITGPGNSQAGDCMTISGMTTETWLNGLRVIVATATPGTGNFTANTSMTATQTATGAFCGSTSAISHANYGTTSDTGVGITYPASPEFFYNNTYAGNITQDEFSYASAMASAVETHKNDLMTIVANGGNDNQFFFTDDLGTAPASQMAASDYNVYYNYNPGTPPSGTTATWQWGTSGQKTTLSSWSTACGGCDSHSVTTDPKLDGTYHLTSGSSAISAGANLTSLCSTYAALCYDKPGTVGVGGDTIGFARPSSGPWDIGAYNYVSSTPATPTIINPTIIAAVHQ